MDTVETEAVRGSGRSRLAVALVAIVACAVVGAGLVGRLGTESRGVAVVEPTPAAPAPSLAEPAPSVASRATPAPSSSPVGPRPVDAFTADDGPRDAALQTPVRLWLLVTDQPDAGSGVLSLFGIVDAPVGQVRIAWSVGGSSERTVTVPTAVVVRGIDDGVQSRHVFRASIDLPTLDGTSSILLDVRSASPGDADIGARVRVSATPGWTVSTGPSVGSIVPASPDEP